MSAQAPRLIADMRLTPLSLHAQNGRCLLVGHIDQFLPVSSAQQAMHQCNAWSCIVIVLGNALQQQASPYRL